MDKPTEDVLNGLFCAVTEELARRIRSGEAAPADINNAIKLLKDNGITCDSKVGEPIDILSQILPFSDVPS